MLDGANKVSGDTYTPLITDPQPIRAFAAYGELKLASLLLFEERLAF